MSVWQSIVGIMKMYKKVFKRLFDVSLAVILLMPALILCCVAILAIYAEDGAPAIFKQVRVGRHKIPFMMFKLRTMAKSTESRASDEVSSSQITKMGLFLRKLKIDELPQLINVLKGEMSFVGARPCLPSQDILINERESLGVLRERPGITGPAQIAGVDMSSPHELAVIDANYNRTITLSNDIKYMIQTATGGGRGDAVRTG